MSEIKYIIIGLVGIMFIGLFTPAIIGSIFQVDETDCDSSFFNSIDEFFDDGAFIGVSIFNQSVGFRLLGNESGEYMSNSVAGVCYTYELMPNIIMGMMILFFVMIVYGVIKAFPTT